MTTNNGSKPTVSSVKASFQAMLAPTSTAVSRKAWGIDVSTIWLPYFTAARTIGAVDEGELHDAALGAPFRLRRDKDTNEVKFSQSGRPMFAVAPELNGMVNRARDNYIAGLLMQTRAVMDESGEAYSAQVERQQKAGQPINDKEGFDLELAELARAEAAHLAAEDAQPAAAPKARTPRAKKPRTVQATPAPAPEAPPVAA